MSKEKRLQRRKERIERRIARKVSKGLLPKGMDAVQLQKPLLEDVIDSFQKSLARANQKATNAYNENPSIRTGDNALFVVNKLNVELKVGLDVPDPASGLEATDLVVDFKAPSGSLSSINFIVEASPVDEVDKEQLTLARSEADDDLDMTNNLEAYGFIGWFIGADKKLRSNEKVKVKTSSTEIQNVDVIETKTDNLGSIKIVINVSAEDLVSYEINNEDHDSKLDPLFQSFLWLESEDGQIQSDKIQIF
ncbi:MAG: hypothetical protein AAGG59_03240 [Bacteroidota bacterium]